MTKRFNKDNPRFRDEFGCVNDLLTGESYLCGESGFVGERDALDTAIALCELLNELAEENEHLKKSIKRQQDSNNECAKLIKEQQKENEQLKNLVKTLIKEVEKRRITVTISDEYEEFLK